MSILGAVRGDRVRPIGREKTSEAPWIKLAQLSLETFVKTEERLPNDLSTESAAREVVQNAGNSSRRIITERNVRGLFVI